MYDRRVFAYKGCQLMHNGLYTANITQGYKGVLDLTYIPFQSRTCSPTKIVRLRVLAASPEDPSQIPRRSLIECKDRSGMLPPDKPHSRKL